MLFYVPLPFAGAYAHGTLELSLSDRMRVVSTGDEAKIRLRRHVAAIVSILAI